MTSKELILAAINHQTPERVPVDLDATPSSTISVVAYQNLMLKKYFVMDIKSNRLCMFSTEDRNKGQCAATKRLKFVHNLSRFALKAKLYVAALKMTWKQLDMLKNCQNA